MLAFEQMSKNYEVQAKSMPSPDRAASAEGEKLPVRKKIKISISLQP